MMLLPASFYAGCVCLYSWISGTLSQPVAKRASGIAFVISVCNTMNVWTSYLYGGAPRYLLAFSVDLVAAALAIGFATALMLYLRRQNQKLDLGKDLGINGPTAAQKASEYRYIL